MPFCEAPPRVVVDVVGVPDIISTPTKILPIVRKRIEWILVHGSLHVSLALSCESVKLHWCLIVGLAHAAEHSV